jgi:hypothetical protein
MEPPPSQMPISGPESLPVLATLRRWGDLRFVLVEIKHGVELRTARLPQYGPRFSEIKSLGEDNFLRFAGFTVYKCPVFGARGNRYNVSEVKDRRDRSNELYE